MADEKPFSWFGGRGFEPSALAPDGGATPAPKDWIAIPIPTGCGCDEFEYCVEHGQENS